MYQITQENADALLNYLASRPWMEVHGLIDVLYGLEKLGTPQWDPAPLPYRHGGPDILSSVQDEVHDHRAGQRCPNGLCYWNKPTLVSTGETFTMGQPSTPAPSDLTPGCFHRFSTKCPTEGCWWNARFATFSSDVASQGTVS